MISNKYDLRILLIMVDIPNHEDSLKELSKTSIINNLTLILCWSAPEAAHYLELFKSSENAQPTAIRSQQAQSYKDSLVEFVTTPRHINKSDAASLISTFGSLQEAVNAQPEQISAVPGWGERKVRQWCNAVREDFRLERAKGKKAPEKRAAGTSASTNAGTSVNAVDIHDDEEEAMLLATAEDSGRVHVPDGVATSSHEHDASQPQEEMSEGIMSALAQLRSSGGQK